MEKIEDGLYALCRVIPLFGFAACSMLEEPCSCVVILSFSHEYPNTSHWFPPWCAIDTLFKKFLGREVVTCRTSDLGSLEQCEIPCYISVPFKYGNGRERFEYTQIIPLLINLEGLIVFFNNTVSF